VGNATTKIKGEDIENNTIFLVGKFCILWNIFEKANNHKLTMGKVKQAVSNINDKECFVKLANQLTMRAVLQEHEINDYVEKRVYPENAEIRYEEKGAIKKAIKFIETNGEYHLEGGLYAIWRIRHNMFHGFKCYKDLDNQVDLFRAMCEVLEMAIK